VNLLETLGDFGGLLLGLVLTLFVFSYVFKDNPLYKIAVHLLVGVSAAYVSVVIIGDVIVPVFRKLVEDPVSLSNLLWLIPIALGALLLLKAVPNIAWIGNSSMAVLIGIGASVGLAGAITGTLLPQILARYRNGLFGLIGALLTISTLAYFVFTTRFEKQKNPVISKGYGYGRVVGRAVITITLAGVFAGLLATSTVLLTERVGFFIDSFQDLFEALLS